MTAQGSGPRRHDRGETCPDCGHIHPACLGHAKHTNEERRAAAIERWGNGPDGPWPCGGKPLRGLEVCRTHGPNTAAREAAADRLAEATAAKAVRRRLGDTTGTTPIINPGLVLARLAGELEAWYDETAAMVADLDAAQPHPDPDGTNLDGTTIVPASTIDVHPYIRLHERSQERLAKILVEMERIGIDHIRAEVDQATAVMLHDVLTAVLARRGADTTGLHAEIAEEIRRRQAIPATVDGHDR